jgi:hypothetical protein
MFLNLIRKNVTPDARHPLRCGNCPYKDEEVTTGHWMCMLFLDDQLDTERDMYGTEHAKRNRDCREFMG